MSNKQFNDSPVKSGISKESRSASGIGDAGGDEIDGEEQEDSSSSNSHQNGCKVEDALLTFRQQWKQELNTSIQTQVKSLSIQENEDEHSCFDNGENKAKMLFMKGVELEQKGKLYEAIHFYRQAVQLVPDIEFRLYDASKSKKEKCEEDKTIDTKFVKQEKQKESDEEDCSEDKDCDLETRFHKHVSKTLSVCLPEFEQKAVHISVLPMEIFLYILRWVVSSDLDLRSLEICSLVCRGFYLCCRDPEIWRLACLRVWGVNCGGLTNYDSWRRMFIERPRLHYNGCYISRTTYLRLGENNFQDQFYRPLHQVEYYRYLRFFPEGVVLMLTTPDDPISSLGQLRLRNPKNSSVLCGHFRLCDDKVVVVLKRQETQKSNNRYKRRRRDIVPDHGEQTFNLELKIASHRRRIHSQLVWQRHSIFTKYKSGQETTTGFDLPASRYPPFWFSRVKSYTAESDTPLQ